MKRGIRDTIRRPDYERDPDWDLGQVLAGHKKHTNRTNRQPAHVPEEEVLEDREERFPNTD
ncbi:MAG: hypothetical protein AB7S52_03760 [Sphaerochaetaceae bacterium]|jgi:hypothetical protein|nr:hypothetical protein [Sphaerochaeta sp.]PKL28676.1 MAG: hypothetical protein CVV46_05120 [Spirochaetae bacterium HGW-Spirochaetae-2]